MVTDQKKGKPAIVFEGLAERLHELPVPGGNYRSLRADGKRLWFLDQDLERKTQLKSIAVDNQGGPPEVLASDVRGYDISADGKKLMLMRNQGQGAPEVLIVDILLPGIDGATLITSLRSHVQFAHSRLIVVTSLDEDQRQPFAFALSGVPVVHKPRLVLDLPAALHAALAAGAAE